jgi:magnesium-transporting ATPase (P-type)
MHAIPLNWRVDFRLRPSRIFLTLATLLHPSAGLALFLTSLPLWLCLLLAALVQTSAIFSFWQERRVRGLHLQEQAEKWFLQAGHGEAQGVVLQRVLVWQFLVVMDFRATAKESGSVFYKRYRLGIFPDSIPADDFRRLRVRLQSGKSSLSTLAQ